MAAPHLTSIIEAKRRLREQAIARRAGEDPLVAGHALAAHVLREIERPAGCVVAGTWPLPGEIDLRPLLRVLHGEGHPIALPETTPRGQALIFRRWTPETRMLDGRFGTQHPDGPPIAPDLVLVPLLAFDRRGGRLGYGGGYYDRTLAGLPRARRVGFAFAAQEVEQVPMEPHDRVLEAIVTERGVLRVPAR
jgi:5-formyltetrahydrofolate cyclo-ligase